MYESSEVITLKGGKTISRDIGEVEFIIDEQVVDHLGKAGGLRGLHEVFTLDNLIDQRAFSDIGATDKGDDRVILQELTFFYCRADETDVLEADFRSHITQPFYSCERLFSSLLLFSSERSTHRFCL